jgi:hypothetical protein
MTIEYKIEEADYITYYLYGASINTDLQKRRRRNRLITPIIFLVIGLLLVCVGLYSLGILYCFIGTIYYWVSFSRYKPRYFKHYQKFVRKILKHSIGKNWLVQFDNDYIDIKVEGSESKVKTTEIEVIYEIPSHLFIKFKGSGVQIIPKGEIKDTAALISELKSLAKHLNIAYEANLDWKW